MTDFPAERTALITGAASPRGIGRTTAARLAADGWAVALVDIDGEGAQRNATEIAEQYGVRTFGAKMDVGDPDEVRSVVKQVEAELPPLVGLANIAGISSPTPFLEIEVEEWDRVIDINLRSVFLVTQAVLPGMVERELGRIVSVSSVSAQRGGGTFSKSAYSAAKAGIIGLSRAVAREMGQYGITVNCISPGPVDTDIMGGTLTDERKTAMAADGLLPRIGSTDDMAALMAFLLGPDSGFITAANYDINGGVQIS